MKKIYSAKKNLLVFLFSLVFYFPLFSQSSPEDGKQILVPHDVFVGDSAEIIYSFRSPVDFFSFSSSENIKDNTLYFGKIPEEFETLDSKVTVRSMTLSRNALDYTLTLKIVPWETGAISFPPFDMKKLCSDDADKENPFFINLENIFISSLSERLSLTSLKPPVSPLLLPETSYVIWFLIIAVILLLILAGTIIVRMPFIKHSWKEFRKRAGFKKNAFKAKRRLKKLLSDKNADDKTFAMNWQKIMRHYLEYRFNTRFTATPSKKIAEEIILSTGDLISAEQEDAVIEMTSIFVRTDYIRYANGSIESKELPREEHAAFFLEGEKKFMIDGTITSINQLEKNEKKGGK